MFHATHSAEIAKAAIVLQVPSNVTVNGRPLREYINEEKGREIGKFLSQELSGLRRTIYR